MSGPSSARPARKGYSAVPTEPAPTEPAPINERIDDGVEDAEQEPDVDEDDLYTSNAPLLSGRSRGNEPPSSNKLCWYHKLFRRSHRGEDPLAWNPPNKKARSWRKIFFWTLFGTLVAAVVGLSISTGILARNVQSCERNRWRYRSYKPFSQQTRLPFNNGYSSSNNRLNFPVVYPPLDKSASMTCKQAWSSVTYVQCHEKIWNRSWDHGKRQSLFDPDPSLYPHALCSYSCTRDLNTAMQRVQWQCTEDDKFDKTDFFGPMSADANLEDGPLAVMQTISRRLSHTCRREPARGRYSSYSTRYCPMTMWNDWHIVDGMYAGNLEGLDAFEAHTSNTRTERQYNGVSTRDECEDIPYSWSQSYFTERHYGPHVNSTSCDWCTMNWFERKLLSWKKDAIADPKTGKTVSLPEYLNRIKHAGKRCDVDAWDRTWARALKKYKDSGNLPEDWNDGNGDSKKPGEPCDKTPGSEPDKPRKGKAPKKPQNALKTHAPAQPEMTK